MAVPRAARPSPPDSLSGRDDDAGFGIVQAPTRKVRIDINIPTAGLGERAPVQRGCEGRQCLSMARAMPYLGKPRNPRGLPKYHPAAGDIMAINSIGGTSRIGSLAELWAQKIQANKEVEGIRRRGGDDCYARRQPRSTTPGRRALAAPRLAKRPTTTTSSPARSKCRKAAWAHHGPGLRCRPAACRTR